MLGSRCDGGGLPLHTAQYTHAHQPTCLRDRSPACRAEQAKATPAADELLAKYAPTQVLKQVCVGCGIDSGAHAVVWWECA